MDPTLSIGLLAVAQIIGLLSAAGARHTAGSRGQTFFQGMFLACFMALGIVTLVSVVVGPGYVLACGTSLAVMVLAATWDLRVAA